MVQGREWLTPWLVLMDSSPVIAQIDVLPLIDVGGTLDITIHLDTDKVSAMRIYVLKIVLDIKCGQT